MEASKQIEIRILSVVRRKVNYYKYSPILQASFFSGESTRQIYLIIDSFFTKYDKKKLTTGNMKILILRGIKDKEIQKECLQLVRKIRKCNSYDNKIIEETIKDFAKRQLVKTAILEALSILEQPNPDFSTIQEYIDRAVNISCETEHSYYDYFKEPAGRIIEEANEKRISTGIPKLDEIMDGGMSPGELCVFIGPPGRGKTLALINMGVGALFQGQSVLHITLEISARRVARRYDLRITRKPFEVLKADPEKVTTRLLKLKKKRGCDLTLKDLSMDRPTVADIRAIILNLQRIRKRSFDTVIVDYGDLVKPTIKYKDSRVGIEEVYEDLRRLAVEFKIPLYTASQSTRKSLNKYIVGMEDVAEAFGKVKVADVVPTLCQTPEEEEENLIRIFMAKSRKRKGHPIIRLEMDPDKMYLGELKDSGDDKWKK